MKKPIIVLVIALLALFVVVSLTRPTRDTGKNDDQTSEVATYFQSQMITLAVADIGQPIEGFDANLLQAAYPGLTLEDFQGVETFEGHYEVANGEIKFVRDQEQPISSAERTISDQGYATLLNNLLARTSFPSDLSEQALVDSLIEMINTSERVQVKFNETATAFGIKVTPIKLLEDSRCPVEVTCTKAGTVRVLAKLESGLGTANQEFTLNKPISAEVEFVELYQVFPPANSEVKIVDSDYVFTFKVTKN